MNDLLTSTVVINVLDGPLAGSTHRITDHRSLTIGRSSQADFHLPDDRLVSRFHCRMSINPPTCSILDLGSRNGVFVNNEKQHESSLKTGDFVRVGGTKFTVVIETNSRLQESLPTLQNAASSQKMDETYIVEHSALQSETEGHPDTPGYQLHRLLGQGGMGEVYLATRLSNGSQVAVKLIRPDIQRDFQIVNRFVREASVVLRLRHKRIVQSIDFQLSRSEVPFLVMEYIDAIDLKSFLGSKVIESRAKIAAKIVVRLLEGLEYAHGMSIVHRDVKPSNVLAYWSKGGGKLNVKLADFGLAKNYIDAGFSDCSTSTDTCGTIAFMPPEQILDCRRAKPACDIYAAGVCLYKMVTGRLPYESDSAAETIQRILNDESIPIAQHWSEIPLALEEIIAKATQREPNSRFQSARAMRDSLLRWLTSL